MTKALRECPECRAELSADARFCSQCGARVVSHASKSSGERRPVAVLFADLAGFTRLTTELDAEEVRALLGRYFEIVDGAITRAGGTVDKHIGDATMAIFGAPVAHGNDIERSVRAACDIHERIGALTAEYGRPLAVHIGIASGEVVAAAVGSATRADYTVTGDAANLASRLEEIAGAGETIVSDDVRRALASKLVVESRGTIAVRGFAGEMPLWRVNAVTDDSGGGRHRLVGRARERIHFASLLEALQTERRGAAIVIRGEPGVGKSRLAWSFMGTAAEQDCACHVASVLDFGVAREREVLPTLTRSLLGLSASDPHEAQRRTLDRAIAERKAEPRVEPFVADLLGIAQSAASRFDAMDADTRTRGSIDAIAALAASASQQRRLVMLVEDIHWANAATLTALCALRDKVRDCAILLVFTTRHEGDPTGVAAFGDCEVIDLQPLSEAEALELAATVLNAASETARRCIERAQGNPLFLTQLVESGVEGDSIPSSIASVVLSRLDRLPSAEKEALQAASVAGQRFDVELVNHMLPGKRVDFTVALSRGLVRQDDVGALAFAHALIREAAYNSLLHSARRELHCGAAEWFTGRDVVLRAEHLERANDPSTAQAFLEAARSEAAALRLANALSLAIRGSRHAQDRSLGYTLQMLIGSLARDLGDAASAVAAFQQAATQASDDAERCAAQIGLASAHRLTSALEPALAALSLAQPIAERLDLVAEQARIAYLRGSLAFVRGDLPACALAHESALSLSRACHDEGVEAQALSGLADVLYANARMATAREAFEQCISLARRRGDLRSTLMNRNMTAVIDKYLGKVERALATVDEVFRDARSIGHRLAEAMSDEVAGLVLVGAGRDEEAAAPLERGLALAREIGSRRFASIDLAMLGVIASRAGDRSLALTRFNEGLEVLKPIGERFAGPILLAGLARIADSSAERLEFLRRGELLLAEGSISHNHFWFRDQAIEASLEARDVDEAMRHVEALHSFAAIEPTPWSDFIVARGRALAEALRGRIDQYALSALHGRGVTLGLKAALPALEAALDGAVEKKGIST
ncbi:MAG TPA: adenylate/guanylate cyclase domain-containing protein [Casimicrobiaceae bacterium]|nr:adenylate/guanylate cyclase domain-containing protein [Casimicrobiaceae bacterium]